MRKLNELLTMLENISSTMAAAEKAYTENPENSELESEFTRTYATEWNLRAEIAREIQFMTGIEFRIAFDMTYKPELAKIIKSA